MTVLVDCNWQVRSDIESASQKVTESVGVEFSPLNGGMRKGVVTEPSADKDKSFDNSLHLF